MTPVLWTLSNVVLSGVRSPRLACDRLVVRAGVTVLLGRSGAGKTSLLNLLAGYERPQQGSVQFQAAQPAQLGLYWLPEDGGLWPGLTTHDHLSIVVPRQRDPSERVAELLARFDLEEVARSTPEQLSMGERSRLGVARVLAAEPNVMLMDEPLEHVEESRREQYWNVVREECADREASFVFATHAPDVALREADEAICVSDGRILWQGAVETLYHEPPSKQAALFLGPTNWFEPDAARHWLGREVDKPCSVRPEKLVIEPSSQGEWQIAETRFGGSLSSTTLAAPSGEQRMFFHRPAQPDIARGMTATIRACLALLFACCGLGCTVESDGPLLRYESAQHRALPSEGVMLPAPRGMTYSPAGELFILDNAGRVVVEDPEGTVVRTWWMPEYDVGKPEGAWVLLDGRIAVADTHYHRIVFFNKTGEVLGTLGEFGREPGQFIYTVAVTQDPQGFLYVAEYGGNDRVQKFTADGEFVLGFGEIGTDPGQFQRPSGVVWDEGTVYVADAINNRIQAFQDDGTFVGIVADAETSGLYYPYDLAKGPDGTLYVAEYGAGRISRLSRDGQVLGRYGREGRRLGELWTPWGIAVSQDGRIAIADTGNRRIVELRL